MADHLKNKALHIGINYVGTSNELSGCINDTQTMAKLTETYVHRTKRLFLTDNTKDKPNKRNIMRAFSWLRCSKCDNTGLWTCNHGFNHTSGTTVYFTYSGHGSQTRDTDGDEKDGIDETIYVLDGNITDDYIFSNLIYPIPKGVRMWVCMDNCHAGTCLDLQYSLVCKDATSFTIVDNNTKQCNGEVIMVSGCRDEQTSADITYNRKAQGALTAGINEILTKEPTTKAYQLMYKLKGFMEKNGFTQRPVISLGGQFVLSEPFFKPVR